MAFGETGITGHGTTGGRMGQMSGDNGPHRIHREIDSTRRAMDQTLSALSQRLTPGHLLDEALHSVRGPGGGSIMAIGARYLGGAAFRQARKHPMPAALITAGVVWMMMEGRRRSASSAAQTLSYGQEMPGQTMWDKTTSAAERAAQAASYKARSAAESAKEMGHQVAETVSDSTRRAAERARQMGQQATESARQVGKQARDMAAMTGERLRQTYHTAAQQTSHAIDDYPLAASFASLAAGAMIGFALPHTRAEDRICGDASSRVKEQAKSKGREALVRGRELAGTAAQAAMSEAKEQGLTPSDLGEKVTQVAHAAKDATQQQMGGAESDQAQSGNQGQI